MRQAAELLALVSLLLAGCQLGEAQQRSTPVTQPRVVEPPSASTMSQREPTKAQARLDQGAISDHASTDVTARGVLAGREYDVSRRVELREGPGKGHPRKINRKATAVLGTTHYLSVDSSVTVRVRHIQRCWADVQVTQPSWLIESHFGWIPLDAIKSGASTNKLSGWIRHQCTVHTGKRSTSPVAGFIKQGSAVIVADDGSGWLMLIDAPIRAQQGGRFVEHPDFEGGLYISAARFTTTVPGQW